MLVLRLLRVPTILLICLSGSPATLFAQQSTSAPTRLALEVTFYPGRKPTYQSVPAQEAKPHGAWYGMVGRIASWQAPAGKPPVEAVRVLSRVEGDVVRVIVSTLSGTKALENEEQVATYLIRENEKISVDELKNFGIEPFGIKLVRVAPNVASAPPVSLEGIESLVVINVVGNESTLPSYKITVLNQSSKNIIAVGLDVVVGGKPSMTATPRGVEGEPLVVTGKTKELTVLAPSRAQGVKDAYSPTTPPNQQIQIKAVVFDDGTYEGAARTCAAVKGYRAGEKMELSRLVPLMEAALNSSDTDISQRLSKLESQVSSLSSDAEPAIVQSLTVEFPQLRGSESSVIKGTIEVTATRIKSDLLKDIHGMQTEEPQKLDAKAYEVWLVNTKERYAKWLSRL